MLTAAAKARWLPRDFVEVSQVGGVYTLAAYLLMLWVFVSEITSFLSSSYTTLLTLDHQSGDLLQINFDVDLYDIECRNLKVMVFAQGGEEPLKTSLQDFWLRSVDLKGRTFGMAMRPEESKPEDVASDGGHKRQMEQLAKEDGQKELDAEWASSHDGFAHKSFDHVIQAHDFTFINFFAGWCSHCQHFAPLWDRLAKRINGEGGEAPLQFADRDGVMRGVRLIRMNCVDFRNLCHEKGIDAYPMLRLYKADGTFSLFEGKRDEAELMRWIERTVKMKSYGWSANHEAFERGCNAKGRVQVPRVPGHLELTAGGGDQNLNTRMTNVSHLLKHLSFSDPDDGKQHRKSWSGMPFDVLSHTSPLDGKSFVTHSFHQTWVHDLKVVSTVSPRGQTVYQFNHQGRLANVHEDVIPQARFHYDIEPFSIRVKQDDKKWYDLGTSLMAILGGSFVVMRLLATASLAALAALKHLAPGGQAKAARSGHLAT